MEGLFRARKASQCSDFIPFLELWREEGHSLGLEGTLSSGLRPGGGLLSWARFWAHRLPPPWGNRSWNPLQEPMRAGRREGVTLCEAPALTSQQLMSQTLQSSWGSKCRVTLTPAVMETDRGVVPPAQCLAPTAPLLLPALPQEPLSSGLLGLESLSFPANIVH